jgi:hypothetical protein
MPGLGTHLLVLDKVRNRLIQSTNPVHSGAGMLIASHPEFAYLGAAAQDLLYLAPDTSAKFQQAADVLVKLADVIAPLVKLEQMYVDPITAQIDQGLNWVTQGLYGAFQATAETFAVTVETLLESLLVLAVDPWELVFPSPPLSQGHRTIDGANSWYWGDMVHYRCTGRFSQTLYNLAKATQDDRLVAFALGSVTHIGADVTVHPFVNAVVGAPYRNHPHRHHFVENFVETLSWQLLTGTNVLDVDLVGRLNVKKDKLQTANDILLIASLPDEVIRLLDRTLRTVYPNPPQRLPGGYLNKNDYNFAYKIFMLLVKLSTSRLDPPQPPPISISSLQSLLNALGLTPPPGLPSLSKCKTLFCAKDLLLAIVDFVKWGLQQLQNIAAAAPALLLSLAVDAAKYVLYLIQSLLYNIYRSFRRVLVWMGFAVPFDYEEAVEIDGEYRDNQEMSGGRSLLSSSLDPKYPHLADHPTGISGNFRSLHHVPYPTQAMESGGLLAPATQASLTYGDVLQSILSQEPLLPFSVSALQNSATPLGTDSTTKAFQGLSPVAGTGNAIEFSTFLVQETLGQNLSSHNWNLDSDRGYAWQTWDWTPNHPAPGSPGTGEVDAFYDKC